MTTTHFLSLPHIVLLEIFTYLSSEDILYAFADLHGFHFNDLLTEHGAFRHICLSSQLPRRQYNVLSNGIWRYDLVRSFVCKEMFSDFINDLTPCQIFPLLTELRILFLRYSSECVTPFIIAHSSTLKHFTATRGEQSFIQESYQKLLHTILPHLSQLTLLNTDHRTYVSVNWNQLKGCLQSLEHLFTFVESMSDVYTLAIDGFLPRLRSLRIHVGKAYIRTVSTELPTMASLRMPKLEIFDLYLKQKEEEETKWGAVETLTSYSVMPRLRRFSLVYDLSTSTQIRHIFQSSLFNNDNRHISVRFALYLNASTNIDSSDITNIFDSRSSRYNELFVKHNDEDKSKLHCTWFTSSWPSWTTFWMNRHGIVPRRGIRQLGIETPNISLSSIAKLFPDANKLWCRYPASLSMGDSSLLPTPLVNIRHLTVLDIVPGLEFLLDGVILPHLHSLDVLVVQLFIALASRANQMKTLDTIDHLVITDQVDVEEKSFSLKQWYIVLDALPRLRTLLVQIHNANCPPIEMADLFINYIRQARQVSLTLFSCCIDDINDTNNKEHFITYLEDTMEMVCSPVQLASISSTRFNAWF